MDKADPTKQPIFSPNIEVDCTNDETIEDNIAVWYYTPTGQIISGMLSEENSLLTTNPIFLLDNGEPNPSPFMDVKAPSDLKSTLTSTSFHSNEFRINYSYDPSGRSEFTIVAYRISPEGEIHWIYSSNVWKKIAEVKRSDIGKDLSKWTLHCWNYTPYGSNYVYWNTYERDWNRSNKDLGHATQNGATVYLVGRTKVSSHWYACAPGNLQNHYTNLNYIYNNWAQWYNDPDKSTFRIW